MTSSSSFRVLIATDGSPSANAALATAAGFGHARQRDGRRPHAAEREHRQTTERVVVPTVVIVQEFGVQPSFELAHVEARLLELLQERHQRDRPRNEQQRRSHPDKIHRFRSPKGL